MKSCSRSSCDLGAAIAMGTFSDDKSEGPLTTLDSNVSHPLGGRFVPIL